MISFSHTESFCLKKGLRYEIIRKNKIFKIPIKIRPKNGIIFIYLSFESTKILKEIVFLLFRIFFYNNVLLAVSFVFSFPLCSLGGVWIWSTVHSLGWAQLYFRFYKKINNKETYIYYFFMYSYLHKVPCDSQKLFLFSLNCSCN